MTPREIAEYFGSPKRVGGDWYCRCPAHDDHTPSLCVTEKDGKILYVCRSGCGQEAVTEAIHRFYDDHKRGGNGAWKKAGDSPSADPVVARYDYLDETGHPLFQVCRTKTKKFPQRRLDSAGGWIWNLDGVRMVLYRLPELVKAAAAANGNPWPVYIVEGEKDAIA